MKGFSKKIFKKSLATILAFAMVITSIVVMNGKEVSAASTLLSGSDYKVTATDLSGSQCKLTFTPNSAAAYVIVHYKVNGGDQMNLNMANNGGNWEYTISGLQTGNRIECSFTYNTNGTQKDTGVATYVTGSSASSANLAAPFGLVASSPKNNTIGVVWGRGDVDSYNVYIDGNKVSSSVACGYYEYSGYAAGTHTVAVSTVSGGSESAKTTASVSVGGSSAQQETGVVYIYQDINYGGRVAALNVGEYRLSDLQAKGFQNDDLSSLKVASGYQAILYKDDNFQGETRVITSDTAWIGSDFNDVMSSIKVQKKSEQQTQAPTTTKTQTSTDTSIQAPFGLVVSCPSSNTIGVVWGRGNIDSYNVYIDGNKVAGGITCGYYTYSGYAAGTHTVAVATVSGNKESARTSLTVNVTGSSTVQTTTKAPEASTSPSYSDGDKPQIPNLAARSDRMYFKMNNKTNGKYSDNQIYWCILGYNSSNQLCYVDKNGNLIPANAGMNTISKSDRKCADICYTLAEKDYVYMPDIVSGRMYMSYGEQVYITFNVAADGTIGYAGPDLNNASDPNQDVFFEFIEFTIKNKEYWGNTTRVDFYSFPVVTRLFGENGYTNGQYYANYDRTVGDKGTRAEIFNIFKNEVPDAFDTLVTDMRIMAPCKLTFNEGAQYSNYYDAYINEFWNKYASQDLVFTCDAGTFRGRVYGDVMRFTKDGDGGTYYVYKPTTQDVLEGKGNFNRGNSTELVIEAQLCAAFNRGVATQPENFNNESAYYKNSVSNFYSGFWHNHSYDGYAYGFCYDDVFDHSTLLHFTNPTGLVIDLKW